MSVKSISSGKGKTAVYVGLAVVLLAAAAVIYIRSTGPAKPDAQTKAAMERNQEIQATMETPQPATPDLPVEARAPRGSIQAK